MKKTLKSLLLCFFISYTATMFMTRIFCAISGIESMDVDYILWTGLFCLGSVLPVLVLYSKREYGNKEWCIRVVIQFFLEEIILLPLGHKLGMWEGSVGFAMFFFAVLAVTAFIHFIFYVTDEKVAKEINEELKNRKNVNKQG